MTDTTHEAQKKPGHYSRGLVQGGKTVSADDTNRESKHSSEYCASLRQDTLPTASAASSRQSLDN